ncbi:MAG: rRNA pseudouridine synthase [Acutalibacter sp.]|nr:rRNA pseudouridine synthase [Acutalibacter sp.]
MAEKSRLQKILASCGVASRRKAEEMILDGRIAVNGRTAMLGDSALPGKDIITLDGERISFPENKYYLALHKPRGFVTTMNDEKGRRCVALLVEDVGERVYPVGRLDKDSEGLLLMTNDGEFANMISHPKRHVAKTYRVTVRPAVTEEQLARMELGIEIDGKMTAPAKARVLEQQSGRVVLEIILYEGRNREIRKMCETLGLEVARLKRIAIGPVRLGMLPQGKYRELTKEEIRGLLSEAKKEGSKKNHDRNITHAGQRTGKKTVKASGSSRGKRQSSGHDGTR